MYSFNWAKAFIFAVLIWVVATLVLLASNITNLSYDWAHGLVALAFGFMAFLLSLNAKPESMTEAFEYGIVWSVIGFLLDAVLVRPYDTHIFASWQSWASYGLALLAPVLYWQLPIKKTSAI